MQQLVVIFFISSTTNFSNETFFSNTKWKHVEDLYQVYTNSFVESTIEFFFEKTSTNKYLRIKYAEGTTLILTMQKVRPDTKCQIKKHWREFCPALLRILFWTLICWFSVVVRIGNIDQNTEKCLKVRIINQYDETYIMIW